MTLQALLAEYERIKEEIFHHKNSQQAVLNFIIFLVAAEIAAGATSLSSFGWPALYLLLVAPVPFAFLALYHSGYTLRIHNLALYLDNDVREKIEKITGTNTLRKVSYRPTANLFAFPAASIDGKLIYLSLFGLKLLPQLLPLLAFLYYRPLPWLPWEYLWFLIDVILMLISCFGQHD